MIARTAIAVALSVLAGFVDAMGFLHLGGYFVSFMSGNSTHLGVVLSHGLAGALLPAALVGLFVLGAIAGTLMDQRLSGAFSLSLLAVLLALASLLSFAGRDGPAIVIAPFAMGAMNTALRADDGGMAVTYMTGNLVKLGQGIVAAFQGGGRWGWAPFMLLWLGLLAGAVAGAVSYGEMGLVGLWIPAVGLIGLACASLATR